MSDSDSAREGGAHAAAVAQENTSETIASRKKPAALGRGLNALFAESGGDAAGLAHASREASLDVRSLPGAQAGAQANGVGELPIAAIRPDPDQPRRQFAPEALAELAESIRARGVLQPILVRADDAPGRYVIIAGERRWRAAQLAGLDRMPALLRDYDEAGRFEIAVIENVQRADLNPLEEAQAYHRLMHQFGHSPDGVARLVGKSRSHVANMVRLLDLSPAARDALVAGTISAGHARALLGTPNADSLLAQILRKGLSVRAVEALARKARKADSGADGGGDAGADGAGGRRATPGGESDADIRALEEHLADLLGVRASIVHGEKGGSLTLHYATLDQLDWLCQRLSGEKI